MSRSRPPAAQPPTARVSAHRARQRADGLRPIQVWVPDMRNPRNRAEARRQSAAVAASATEAEEQAFIESVADWPAD